MRRSNKVNHGWKEYFNFSYREKKGVFYLLLIITVQLIILLVMRMYPPELKKADEKKFLQLVMELQKDTLVSSIPNKNNSPLSLRPFDPNDASDSTLLEAGFKPFQIRIIRNYLSKGGKFRVKSDMKKMWSVDAHLFKRIAPLLLLPDSMNLISKYRTTEMHSVDLSSADSSQLVELRGIGPALAKRILNYRNALGGFTSIDQLKEVYGISDSLFQKIAPTLVLDTLSPVRKININTDSLSVLAAHPYLKYKVSYGLIKYRKQHGRIHSLSELGEMRFVPPEIIPKIAPYLKF